MIIFFPCLQSQDLNSATKGVVIVFKLPAYSVQFSHSVMSDSLWLHGLQHTRPPWPSPTLRAYSNSCPLSWWCHPTISSSVVPLSSCLQSFPASGSFPVSQFFALGGQSIGASASASVFPMSVQGRFPLRLSGFICLLSQGLSGVFSSTTCINFAEFCLLDHPALTTVCDHWEDHSLDYMEPCGRSNISGFSTHYRDLS